MPTFVGAGSGAQRVAGVSESDSTIEVRRIIGAPIDEVFSAWLDAEGMREWMSPLGTATMTADFPPGGSFRLVMLHGETSIEHVGVYRVIDPPHRIVFTWRSQYTGPIDTVVTIDLRSLGAEETEIVVTHELLPVDEREPHRGGWTAILGRLDSHLRPHAA
jgi:uncharacterized protein YndB with AHSA1/START domain